MGKILKREIRNCYSSLATTPTVSESLKKIAYMRDTSQNNLIHGILLEYVKKHKSEVEAYDREVKK